MRQQLVHSEINFQKFHTLHEQVKDNSTIVLDNSLFSKCYSMIKHKLFQLVSEDSNTNWKNLCFIAQSHFENNKALSNKVLQ